MGGGQYLVLLYIRTISSRTTLIITDRSRIAGLSGQILMEMYAFSAGRTPPKISTPCRRKSPPRVAPVDKEKIMVYYKNNNVNVISDKK